MQLTGSAAFKTSKQLQQALLCDACEHLLKLREDYVADLCAHDDGRFPFMDHVLFPHTELHPTMVVELVDLDADALAYFALSVLWREDVTRHARLGSYREVFRQYLLAPANGFPNDVYVWLGFYPTDPWMQGSFHAPTLNGGAPCDLYRFPFLGLEFSVLLCPGPSVELSELCIVRSRQKWGIVGGPHSGSYVEFIGMFATSKAKGRLAREQ